MNYTEDITSPLDAYRDHFQQDNAEAAEAVLDELIKLSGVDVEGNKSLCGEIHELEDQLKHGGKKCRNKKLIRLALILLSILLAAIPILRILHLIFPDLPDLPLPNLAQIVPALLSAAGFWYVFSKLNKAIRTLADLLRRLREECDKKIAAAYEQLHALNELFDWGTVAEVVRRTIPNLVLDNFFSQERLADLKDIFGWTDDFNRDKSILYCHSGDLQGNPFVLAESLNYKMGMKTYTGSLSISWQEQETYTDDKGHTHTRWVTRHETLHASVDKPCPEYHKEKFLVYGNEAAPDLSFSRTPTGLADGSLFDKTRLKWRMSSQKEKARKDVEYTVTANRTFNALFNADDRDHEIQFRLLFTPLAQEEMVKLLQDNDVGYGDDFIFRKRKKINMILPAHLRDFDISASPDRFRHYDLEHIRGVFLSYNAEFFKAFYFTMAPLLVIPLYQQTKPPKFGTVYNKRPGSVSFWECESLANSFDPEMFRHPQSVTKNILKTTSEPQPDGDTLVSVTAHGFRGVEHTDYISKHGGDGHWHDVPVHWIEYIPVQKTSPFFVRETPEASRREFDQQKSGSEEWRGFFKRWGMAPAEAAFRRGMVYGRKEKETEK
ncbi:MAG: hypothetical protein J6Y92_03635 [Lentisphaeria bacterium]|nr:hypothetical protein [Lentisphaeria bacterium]